VTSALDIQDLVVDLAEARSGRRRRILHGITLHVAPGEAVGLVGSSGCGKTTFARAALRLVLPTSGVVKVNGIDLATLRGQALRKFRRHMQMVFQDPAGALNGRMRVGELIAEPIRVHEHLSDREVDDRVRELTETVGLTPDAADRWPHQFSGGQRQRICIARALACRPSLLVCDEPTSSLDVSIQAKILNLLNRLRDEHGLAMLFITHDLAVARYLCNRIAVMDGGKIVESGDTDAVLDAPAHSVTRELVAAAG
jgi:ABC-type glutathione transport system ATPase component